MSRTARPRRARAPSGPRRVFGYARVSGAEQGRHGHSLEAQQVEIRSYCERLGLPDPDIRAEVASGSAEQLARRTQLGGLLSDVAPGDLVLVTRVDRWSRDIVHAVGSVRKLVADGVGWTSIGDGIDATTPNGASMLGLMAWAADNERQRIIDRTVGTRAMLRDQGRYVEGLAPLGYRRERGGVLHVVADQARIVRAIFKRCIGGESIAQLVRSIAEDYGFKRDKKGIHNILRNRLYLGEAKDQDGQWFKAEHEPIIDATTFRRAGDAMQGRQRHGRNPSAKAHNADWLLRSFATCAECGSRMSSCYRTGIKGRLVDYYYCAGRIAKRGCEAPLVSVAEADDAAAELVRQRLGDLRRWLSHEQQVAARPANAVVGDRRALEQKRERIIDLAQDGDISKKAMRHRLHIVDEAIADLDEREAAERRRSALVDGKVRRRILRQVEVLDAAWRVAGPKERRDILHAIASGVVLRAGESPKPAWIPPEDLVREL